jgi:tetratricopeptide (TPR) repeat protein
LPSVYTTPVLGLTLCVPDLKLKGVFRLSSFAILREVFLRSFLCSWARGAAVLLGLAPLLFVPVAAADNSSPLTLDTSETLFAVLTAINACGYDENLNVSDAQRSNIRAEVQRGLQGSEEAQGTATTLCVYYQAHRGRDAAHDLSQYVSLALYLQGPPHFLPKVKEDEMPPDAAAIAGFAPLLDRFYEKAGLHAIWERHKNQYAALADRYHAPLAKMVFDTEIYLKLASAGYLGRAFTIYLDLMGDPDQANARIYGPDYYVVVFPSPDVASKSPLKMDQVRHTYLHYLIDPLAEKHFTAIKRLEPLLQSVKRAPLEDIFKSDISLLVTECMVRAVEIRTTGGKQTAEAMRAQAVDDAVRQGYILTRHFYDALAAFEKDPAGIRTAYPDFLNSVDVKREEKAASEVKFANAAPPEVVQLSRMEERKMLVTAEKRLAAGDAKGAQDLAQQALAKNIGDRGRALFILAEVAVNNKDIAGARDNFQKAIDATRDPKVVAWSHVYLGRIADLKEEREAAMNEYRAALNTGGELPEIKAAAERGLERPYAPPAKPQ